MSKNLTSKGETNHNIKGIFFSEKKTPTLRDEIFFKK